MARSLRNKVQHEAYYLVWLQLGIVCLIASITWIMLDINHAMAVISGGFAYGLPNLVFVWLVFRFVGAHQTSQFIAAFFAGEAFKLILSGILFVFIVKYLPVSLLSVLIGFISAIIAFWLVCIWYFMRPFSAK